MTSPDPDFRTEPVERSAPGATTTVRAGSSHDAAAESQQGTDPFLERREGETPSEPSRPLEATQDDSLLDLLERWEDGYRRGEDRLPEALGVTDPTLCSALRERIERRKRLYALLQLPEVATAGADVPLPQFPDHEVLAVIGRGGMGVVYQARDQKLGRVVAIKTIAEGRQATADHRARFQAEAQAIARLRHPHIIAIHAVGEHDGQPYLILEFAEGGSLADRLVERPLAPAEAAALIARLAAAVHAAHCAGVVHRDLKPSNILLTAEGIPKVSDFGLAKLIDSEAGRTISGQVIGSPSFMAPEQAEGRSKQVGPAADVYAMGAILYQALTGRPPFLGQSAMETLKLVTSAEAVPPRRLRPDVPRDLETICLKCLEKEPGRRYASALTLAEDLNRYLSGRPIQARRSTPLERLVRWSHREPWLAGTSLTAAGLAAVLAIGGAASAVVFRKQRNQITADLIRIQHSEAETRDQRDRALLAEGRARENLLHAQEEEKAAQRSRAEMRAVLDFFQNKVLAAARPKDQQGGLGKDVSLRAALETAQADLDRSFASQPAVEASIRDTLGETYYYLGEPEQARRQFERAVALRRRALGSDHPETLGSMDNLAHVYLDAGRLAESLSLLGESLKRREARLGPDHPETLTSRNNLAVAYQQAGRLAEALPLYEETLARRRAALGPDHPETLFSLNNLASAYREAGRLADARPLYEEALQRRRATLGPDHPDTLMSMNNLANLDRELGRLSEALSLQKETLQRQQAALGPDHPDTLLSMSNLALAYEDAGQASAAMPLYEETLKRRQAKLGPDHPETLVSMSNLAVAYHAAGRPADALPLFEETLRRRRATRGPDHPQTLRSVTYLARAYLAGQPGRAEPLLREALAIRAQKFPDDWRTFETQSLLGASLLDQKKYAEAEPHLLEGYEGMKARVATIPASSRRYLAETADRIIQLYDAWGKPAQAEAWRRTRTATSNVPARP
jgi:non-specific serine/threonine protein kinase/serine/threonine-protein kinase